MTLKAGCISRIGWIKWSNPRCHLVFRRGSFPFDWTGKQRNCRFWGSEKPNMYLEKPVHGEKVTVWAAMSSAGIIWPFFFWRWIGIYCDCEQWPVFKTPTAHHVLAWLKQTFVELFISFSTAREWPPQSTGFSRLDFFLCGYFKAKVYTPLPESLDELKTDIRREMQAISVQTCASVFRHHENIPI